LSTFVTSVYRRARKVHLCEECRRDIVPGETYSRVAGATDGRGWSVALCLACDALNEAVWDVIRSWNLPEGEGPAYGQIVAWIEEAETAADLTPAALGHYAGLLFARREKAGAGRRSG
jgi:hypothetical protein